MQSFYGGKSGFSFIIVKNYLSINDMVNDFKKGPQYSTVHFDEHILINTENKNDPDNGKIFRRGYDYTNELGGAVYIGTIVGPAGRAPMLELTTIDEVKNKQVQEGYDYRYNEGEYSPTINLVPGKVSETEYNDSIEWASCCIRNENNEDSTAYIGFKIPYTVIDFTAETVSAYYNRSNETENFVNQNLSERQDTKEHPFFEKWHFKIPKGIKGDSFKNFRVLSADPTIRDYIGKEDDIANNREVLVYDYYHYDKDGGGEPATIYLGDYNMINSISVNDEGTFIIDYSHDDDLIYNKLFKWIKQIELNNENGHFTIQYNHTTDKDGNPTTYETDLNWVKDIKIDEEGTATFKYTYNEDFIYNKLFKWIEEVTLDNNGHLTIRYNHETDKDGVPTIYETDLDWVQNITMADNGTITLEWSTGKTDNLPEHLRWIINMEIELDGTIIVNYNDGTKDIFDNKIQWITNVSLLQDGTFTIKYNNGTPDYITQLKWVEDITIDKDGTVTIIYNYGDPVVYDKMIKYISNINLDPDGTVTINYNTGDTKIFDKKIKWINEISLLDDGTFTIKYNNDTPDYTYILKWAKDIILEEDGTIKIIYNNGDDPTTYDQRLQYIKNVYIDNDKEDSDYKLHIVYNTDKGDVPVGDPIKFIKDIYIDDSKEDSDYKFHVVYNTNGDNNVDVSIGESINYIVETDIDKTDYHYLVYYSNANYRKEIIDSGRGRTYKEKDGWLDLGSIKDDSGVLIGLNIPLSEVNNSHAPTDAINYLNTQYPDGLTNKEIYGKIVTIGEEFRNKNFYAFDYDIDNGGYRGWYFLGSFDDGVIQNLVAREDDPNIEILKNDLEPGVGIWFIVEGDAND